MKLNCWEFEKCGREPGGLRAKELGVCPATIERKVDGVNKGINAGRCCWAVAGTLCKGEVQGVFASKVIDCMNCDFYKQVLKEEKNNSYASPSKVLEILNKN